MTEKIDHGKRLYYERINEEAKVDLNKQLTPPPIAISYGSHEIKTKNGIKEYKTPICTYGNFSFIYAPPKAHKSYLVSLLASTYLNGQNGTRCGGTKLQADRHEFNGKGKRVLHFDTEQSDWHSQHSFNRVVDMAGTSEGYEPFALRPLKYGDRMEFIEYKILHENVEFIGKGDDYKLNQDIGLVIIDGIADLVSDVNDIMESSNCVQKLLTWTAYAQCHIITIIHSNWGSQKPTGHLGSFCEKKCETQIILEKEKDVVSDEGIVNVRCKRSRNKPFDPFSFKINKSGYPEIIGADFPIVGDF